MKKRYYTVALMVLFMLISLSARCVAANETYKIGLLMSFGPDQDAQLKKIITDILAVFAKRETIVVKPVWFASEEEFRKSVEKKEVDFVYTKYHDNILDLIEKYNYKPFISATLFGKKESSICFYVKKKRVISKANELRGMKVATYRTRDGYFYLQKLLNEKPTNFFSVVTPVENGPDAMDMMDKEKVDVAFVYTSNMERLKLTNSKVASGIKQVACTKGTLESPFMASPKVPEAIVEKLQTAMENAMKDEALKQYWPLMRNLKMKFYKVKKSDYEDIMDIYKEARKKGWEQEYQAWLK